ncbi:MAG: hypothetical protein IJA10_10875 [Lachnospiraceae bacterium]|nr:hypothetical protein [Lachnospiraceae bacterium]
MNRKEIYPLRTIIEENYMDENKAYLIPVDETFNLGYSNVLFSKIGNDFYFLPMDTFLSNFIPCFGEKYIKRISKDILKENWKTNKKDIQKQFKITKMKTIDEYMYVFIYCLETERYEEVGLGSFENLIDLR